VSDERPTVTIAIPVLNEGRYIDRCLDAVAAQTYTDVVEVLVVDGGSTDCTQNRVVARGGPVVLLDNPRRIQAAALNVALGEARGDILVPMDDGSAEQHLTIDSPVPSHQLAFSWCGAGISPISKCALGLAPLNSDSGMPTTAVVIVAEPLLNRNCNKSDKTESPVVLQESSARAAVSPRCGDKTSCN